MLCLAVVGLTGAGKTEFLRLAVELGFACLEWSEILAPDLDVKTKDRRKMHQAAACLVQSRGLAYYPKKIFDTLSALPGARHAVSGARNPGELESLRRYYSFFRVAWISSHYLARFARCVERKRGDYPVNLEEFIRQDMYELAHGLAEIACSLTDDILFNDGNLETYRETVRVYLSKFSDKGRSSE